MNVRMLVLRKGAAIERTEPDLIKKIESASEALNRNASPYKRLATGEDALQREYAVLLLVCNDVPDELGRYGLFAPGEPVNQGGIAQDIDHARDPTAGYSDNIAGLECEKRPGRGRAADCLQPKRDVMDHVMLAQGIQMEIRGDALRKLVELRRF